MGRAPVSEPPPDSFTQLLGTAVSNMEDKWSEDLRDVGAILGCRGRRVGTESAVAVYARGQRWEEVICQAVGTTTRATLRTTTVRSFVFGFSAQELSDFVEPLPWDLHGDNFQS